MIHIRRMDCDSEHDECFEINRPDGTDCCLLLFVKTRARFVFDGKETVTEPNTFVVFNKYSPQHYFAYGGKYIDHWMLFELPDEIYSGMSAVFDRPIQICSSERTDEYMHLICDAFYRSGTDRICSFLVRTILEEIRLVINQSGNQTVHLTELLALRKEIYAHPEYDWSVRKMAEKICVSEPYFQELYKNSFGTACGADVINSRIEAAKLLITDTALPIAEIGEKCGYNSSVHFSRQFKQITGYSPVEYRTAQLQN